MIILKWIVSAWRESEYDIIKMDSPARMMIELFRPKNYVSKCYYVAEMVENKYQYQYQLNCVLEMW
jgi:hypothetical protein